MSQDQPDTSAFTSWLSAQVDADGGSHRAIELRHGFPRETLRRALVDGRRPLKPLVRQVAEAFGADPDQVAVWAGYPDVRIPAPDPHTFLAPRPRPTDWWAATLRLHNESQRHAAAGIGVSAPTVQHWVKGTKRPDQESAGKIATYFGVDPHALYVLFGIPVPTTTVASAIDAAAASGMTLKAIAEAAGVSPKTARKALREETAQPRERVVRGLAAATGEDEDRIAEATGYARHRLRIPPADPGTESPFKDAIAAALLASPKTEHKTLATVSQADGFSPTFLGMFFRHGASLERESIRLLEQWLELPPGAFGPRPKSPAKGFARASKAQQRLAQAKSVRTRVARGRWYRSEESGRWAGRRPKGHYRRISEALIARYGRDYFKRAGGAAGVRHTQRAVLRLLDPSPDETIKKWIGVGADEDIDRLLRPKRRGRPRGKATNGQRTVTWRDRELAIAAATAFLCGVKSRAIAELVGWAAYDAYRRKHPSGRYEGRGHWRVRWLIRYGLALLRGQGLLEPETYCLYAGLVETV
jgi:transcriptional regulator with XRE-family HTH domain